MVYKYLVFSGQHIFDLTIKEIYIALIFLLIKYDTNKSTFS